LLPAGTDLIMVGKKSNSAWTPRLDLSIELLVLRSQQGGYQVIPVDHSRDQLVRLVS
jgi:hypothetical protein